MGDVLLNGREPEPWEQAAITRARQQERDEATGVLLAGVLTAVPVPRHEGRAVSDIGVEFSRVRRAAADVLPVLP
jgi:hypothetical protein